MFKYQLKKDDKTATIFKIEDGWNFQKEIGSCLVENINVTYNEDLAKIYIELLNLGYEPISEPGESIEKSVLKNTWYYIKKENEFTIVKSNYGTAHYYFNEQLHREDGPAVLGGNHWVWYKNGKEHRVNGPSCEVFNIKGNWYRRNWCFEGNLHRENGPAVEWLNGYKEYRIHGKLITEKEFNKQYGQNKLK